MVPLPFFGHPDFATIFWGAFSLWCVLETYGLLTKRSLDRSKARDRGSAWLLVLLLWLGLALAFGLSLNFPQGAIPYHRTLLFFVGIILMLAGLAFRFYAMRVLGRSFTYNVAVQPGQAVIDAGPYRYIRHPSYTGALITLVGLGLALGSWAALLAILLCTGIAYAYRIHVEESALVAVLGEPYKQYMRHTRRLIPFLF
jgi:protein-S-isoprenylcysteine O-methyltransferase Ste14